MVGSRYIDLLAVTSAQRSVQQAGRLVATKMVKHTKARVVCRQLLDRERGRGLAGPELIVLLGLNDLDRAAAEQVQKIGVRHADVFCLCLLVLVLVVRLDRVVRFDRAVLERHERIYDVLDCHVRVTAGGQRLDYDDQGGRDRPDEYVAAVVRHGRRDRVPCREKDANVVVCEHDEHRRHVDQLAEVVPHGQAQRGHGVVNVRLVVFAKDVDLSDLFELVVDGIYHLRARASSLFGICRSRLPAEGSAGRSEAVEKKSFVVILSFTSIRLT